MLAGALGSLAGWMKCRKSDTKSSSTSAIGTERSGLGSVSSCGASAVSAAKAETSGEGQRSINRGVGNSEAFFFETEKASFESLYIHAETKFHSK